MTSSSGPAFDYSAFDLEQPELPEEIEAGAMQSGGYPYPRRMRRKAYERELRLLQIELLKLQRWMRESGARLVILFEGRDTAGKGGTIKRFMEHLNPRHAHVVALSKPTETERGEWYFQRYVAHLPTAGDMALFDRSWYNRAGVERVMGFCTMEQVRAFLREAPEFEAMLVRDGIILVKLWLTIGRAMQLKRLHARRHDPLKHWKLSPIDLKSIPRWDDYTAARDDLFEHTHTPHAPWTVIRSNDKRRARLNAIRHVLTLIDYEGKDAEAVGAPDPRLVGSEGDIFKDA
ncbi:MAG: polyphosphate kinase 2 [Methyloligellaceae bacterium]